MKDEYAEEYRQIVDYIYEKTGHEFSYEPAPNEYTDRSLTLNVHDRFREGAMYKDFTAVIDRQLHRLVYDITDNCSKDRNRIATWFSRKNFWED